MQAVALQIQDWALKRPMAQMVWQQPPQPRILATDVAIRSPTLNIIYDRNIAAETCLIIDFIYFHCQLPGESCDQTSIGRGINLITLTNTEKE